MASAFRGLATLILMMTAATNTLAETTLSFTGTVTAIDQDEGFFEAPRHVAVGSVVNGTITYAAVADYIHDPNPGDCNLGYVFGDGVMTISMEGKLWVYDSLAVLVGDCVANDLVEFVGQTAIAYPPGAPAHQLVLKVYDQTPPYELVNSMDLPVMDGDLDTAQITRMLGRVVNFTWGEIRFEVDSISIDGTVPVHQSTWGGVKALYGGAARPTRPSR